jgi:hypothetical protein
MGWPAFIGSGGLRAGERLDLAFFIHRQHDGMSWWIDVEPNHVAQLGGEGRVCGQLELPDPVRLQAVPALDPLHG